MHAIATAYARRLSTDPEVNNASCIFNVLLYYLQLSSSRYRKVVALIAIFVVIASTFIQFEKRARPTQIKMIAKQEHETEAFVVEKAKDDFQLRKVTMGPIRPDEVLIEMKYSGICHTVSTMLAVQLVDE